MQPLSYQGSLASFISGVNDQFDNGFEIDEEMVKKIIEDQVIVRGDSLFDKKVFANIKKEIIKKVDKDNKSVPLNKLAMDANKELKKFSPIEVEYVKDVAIKNERARLKKLEQMEFQNKLPQRHR